MVVETEVRVKQTQGAKSWWGASKKMTGFDGIRAMFVHSGSYFQTEGKDFTDYRKAEHTTAMLL